MARILFRMLPQIGHHNATYKLAEELKNSGHEIYYAANHKFKSSVEENGFLFFEIPEADDIVVFNSVRKESLSLKFKRFFLGFIYSNFLISKRVKQLCEKDFFSEIISTVKPDLIFIDTILKTFSLQIIPFKIPFITVQTTVSNLKYDNVPPYDSLFIPQNNFHSRFLSSLFWKLYSLRRIDKRSHLRILKILTDKVNLPSGEVDKKRYYDFGFKTIPEINTSPYEFDFPHKLESNYFHYWSNSLYERNESTVEYSYPTAYNEIKNDNKKTVFCSFGSLSWRYPDHNTISRRLVKLFKEELLNFNLIICVDDYNLRRELRNLGGSNIFIFKRVPQIKVLRNLADIMINHGGLNSIIECIYTNTPMLVFPGSRLYDQFGNAARIKYHKIGLYSSNGDSTKTIRNKILDLALNPSYQENLNCMKSKIEENPGYKDINKVIVSYINKNTAQKTECIP